jgi:hypothetical protein
MRKVDVSEANDSAGRLAISTQKVCLIVAQARVFDVKHAVADPGFRVDPVDDAMVDVLEDGDDDTIRDELLAFIQALSEDEQTDLIALHRLGRGDGDIEEWDEVRGEAARDYDGETGRYLLGQPQLADHLEDALSQFGQSCRE